MPRIHAAPIHRSLRAATALTLTLAVAATATAPPAHADAPETLAETEATAPGAIG